MKDIKTLYFEDVEDFVSSVMCEFDELNLVNFENISVIASASEVADLVAEFIRYGMNIAEVHVSNSEYDLYDGEYALTLSSEGLWCERFKHDKDYFEICGTIVYISNEANSKCIKKVDFENSENIYAFEIGEDDIDVDIDIDTDIDIECDGDCENCHMCDDEDDSNVDHTITIKANIDADEAMKVIDEMERRIRKMSNEMFMFDNFFRRRLL